MADTTAGGGGGGAPAAAAPKSPAVPPARPLQVVVVSSDEDKKPIALNEDALAELSASFARVRAEHGELPLVVHSAAGTFREGKSFILDCFLRYLYHLENTDQDDIVLEHATDADFLEGVNLQDGLPDGSAIFETRSSTDRVTAGIWLYSRPFVVRAANGKKMAVLLMDTQGLFDTAAASSLDAPIFGLSVLLSSKQIINKRGQFTTNDWQLLNLFTEFANEIVRRLHHGKDPELLGAKAFQELEFLSRDFQNFQMRFDEIGTEDEHGLTITPERFLAHCKAASNEYLDKMTAQMERHHSEVHARIQGLYQRITCTCLTHPGEKMTHPRWNGSSDALSDTFRALVARYCRSSFEAPAPKLDILGAPMTLDAFVTWVREYTQCMVSAVERGQLPNVDEVVRVVTQHQLTRLQEVAVSTLKEEFARASNNGKKHLPDKALEEIVRQARTQRLDAYRAAAQFGPESEIEASVQALEARLDDVEAAFRDRNQLAMTQILVFFAPWATLAVVLYLLDWISDWVCDSYLDFCVSASSIMAFYYTVFFVTLIGYCGMKYREYGPQGLWAAIAPLATAVAHNFEVAVAAGRRVLGLPPLTQTAVAGTRAAAPARGSGSSAAKAGEAETRPDGKKKTD